jgi:hypothetical protein
MVIFSYLELNNPETQSILGTPATGRRQTKTTTTTTNTTEKIKKRINTDLTKKTGGFNPNAREG